MDGRRVPNARMARQRLRQALCICINKPSRPLAALTLAEKRPRVRIGMVTGCLSCFHDIGDEFLVFARERAEPTRRRCRGRW